MWTGRAFHPKSYIVQRRERDVATRLSKFIDIDDSSQSTPRVIRSKVTEIDKRKTRTSGNMESEEWTCGFFEEKIMPRRHLEESSLTIKRVDRAQTAPVNVEALQSAAAEVVQRNNGEPKIYFESEGFGFLLKISERSLLFCFLLLTMFSKSTRLIFGNTRSLFPNCLGDHSKTCCHCYGGEVISA